MTEIDPPERQAPGPRPQLPAPTLLSLVLRLRPAAPGPPLPFTGRAAHALLMACLDDFDPSLAEQQHKDSGPRPFTASALLGGRRGLDPEQSYALRLTALTTPVAQALRAAADAGRLAPGRPVQLADAPFTIETAALTPADHPWAASLTYEELSAPWLLGKQPPEGRLTLRFASPTAFKSAGLHVPVPLPAWVFGSLLEKWNAFAPVLLPVEVRRFVEECLALSAYKLRSASVALKAGSLRVGAVGWARYTAVNRDRYWLSVTNLLADFALFAGVGVGTSMGLGQCRREQAGVPPAARRDQR
jgi:CRISPR-associated endoribonuclease Cas6